MPKIVYENKKLSAAKLAVVRQANAIIAEYEADGYDLTLRQLYYQFVARGLIENKQSEYKRLGDIIGDARMAGLIDWNSITDRTRMLRKRGEWEHPQSILDSCADQFRIDLWRTQEYRPEVWVEKDALVGVFQRVCEEHGVAYFSCRGYTSLSELWAAARRLERYIENGQRPVILHFGDHDPSGIDMTRDIMDRLFRFIVVDLFRAGFYTKAQVDAMSEPDNWPFVVKRLALNMDQVEEYSPPPNPAKITDSRAKGYIEEHGLESWELDALDPRTLSGLVTDALDQIRDVRKWEKRVKEEEEHRRNLGLVATNYPSVVEGLNGNGKGKGK